jgi:hypothetical protein
MAQIREIGYEKGAGGSDMRIVIKEDRFGYKRAYWVKNEDHDDSAEEGIPLNPPDLDLLEWEEVKRDLHNMLVDRGLFTWVDVQRAQNGVTSSILAAMRKKVISLYRNREVD